MTLFSESGILSVKTGGQREIAQMEEQEKQRLFEIAGKYEDCVYIEVSSVQSGSTLVYHLGDAVGIVKPGVHIGMFQDSVLYMKYATEKVPAHWISGIFRRDSVMSWRPTTGPIILSRP